MNAQAEINNADCLDLPGPEELAVIAQRGGGLDWLDDEPDVYTDADLMERFEWRSA